MVLCVYQMHITNCSLICLVGVSHFHPGLKLATYTRQIQPCSLLCVFRNIFCHAEIILNIFWFSWCHAPWGRHGPWHWSYWWYHYTRRSKNDPILARATAYNHMLQRAICYRPSVCLSVRLSVTRVDQSKTAEVRIMQLSPQVAPW